MAVSAAALVVIAGITALCICLLYTSAVCAVEVPLTGEVTVPEGCEVIEVGERQLLCFQASSP